MPLVTPDQTGERAEKEAEGGESADRGLDPHELRIRLSVDGEVRQEGSTNLMLHRIPALIEHVTKYVTLEAGDVILTGTPEGVGPVEAGQVLEATLLAGAEPAEPSVEQVLGLGGGSTEQVLDTFTIPVVAEIPSSDA